MESGPKSLDLTRLVPILQAIGAGGSDGKVVATGQTAWLKSPKGRKLCPQTVLVPLYSHTIRYNIYDKVYVN